MKQDRFDPEAAAEYAEAALWYTEHDVAAAERFRAHVLATIAYLLLSGCLPFTAKTPREMFSQLLSQPPTPLNSAKPGLKFPAVVEHVVMRGLSKDPRQRYSDSVTFAKELDAALKQGESADAGGILSRMKSIFRR